MVDLELDRGAGLDRAFHDLTQVDEATGRLYLGETNAGRVWRFRVDSAGGLSERTVIFKHALRNALIPMITLLGLYLPFLLSGAVLVETIFGWPGMGRAIMDAILQRDYPMVMATSFVIAAMVVLGNLLSDVLYAVVDPRIRTE